MQKYASFNQDQLSVLRSQLQSVIDQLEWLGDGMDVGGVVSLDLAGFTGAVASLTNTVQQASRELIDTVVDDGRKSRVRTSPPEKSKGDFVCCASKCRTRRHYARGLCRKCYSRISNKVRQGDVTWDELERRGRAKPPRKTAECDSAEMLNIQADIEELSHAS